VSKLKKCPNFGALRYLYRTVLFHKNVIQYTFFLIWDVLKEKNNLVHLYFFGARGSLSSRFSSDESTPFYDDKANFLLYRYEFTVAMHLVYRALQGDMIPDQVGFCQIYRCRLASPCMDLDPAFSTKFKPGVIGKIFDVNVCFISWINIFCISALVITLRLS